LEERFEYGFLILYWNYQIKECHVIIKMKRAGKINTVKSSIQSNILKLGVASDSNKGVYSDSTFTTPEEGSYKIEYIIRLGNHPPGSAFDGTRGVFGT